MMGNLPSESNRRAFPWLAMQFLFRDAVAGENLRGEAPGKLQNAD